MREACPECGSRKVKRSVEAIREPVGGRVILYASWYHGCLGRECKTTWYGTQDMREQMANRARALSR